MVIYLSRGQNDAEVSIRFPAEPDVVWPIITQLDEHSISAEPVKIVRTYCPISNLTQYIACADLEQETDIQKLNTLNRMIDSMCEHDQNIFSGALDAESVNGLDDVLRVASSLDQYEFIQGVTSDKELGGWLVEHGRAGVDFPKEVWPYLDYAGIGAEYCASHGGAYTPSGYVKRQDNPEHTLEDKSRLSLVLCSGRRTCRLDFPVSDAELETARQKLDVGALTDGMIDSILIGYSWSSALPQDDITLEGFNTFAQYVQQMSHSGLRLFGAALEVEEPTTFSYAVYIAENLDDYELVCNDEGEYGREALRYAGADNEILEMLDGFTDFEALGRFEMEQDGVRETGYGSIKRLSSPFPQQAEQGQTMY